MEENKLSVVMYHYVRDLKNSRYPEIKGCDVRLFKEQIGFLKKHYNFVTVEEVIDVWNNKKELPPHAVLLTFDDAYKDHFDYVFPILEHEHIQGAFYPPVKAITEHTVLDVNKIHFILASTPVEKFNNLLNELRLQLDKYREEYNLESYEYYFNKLAVAGRFDPKEVIFVKRLLQVELPEDLRRIIADDIFVKTRLSVWWIVVCILAHMAMITIGLLLFLKKNKSSRLQKVSSLLAMLVEILITGLFAIPMAIIMMILLHC